MITILTSSPTGNLDGSFPVTGFDYRNGFSEYLKKVWPEHASCLMITAFPKDHEASDNMTLFFKKAAEDTGLSTGRFDLWDDRTEDISEEKLLSYDVIFLGGGHVPTQNKFFSGLELRKKLQKYDGILIGISAGSMNLADVVYAQPELEGEVTDPSYERFLTGLGKTEINVLPHYQMIKDHELDGYHLFNDITCRDSAGKMFIALVDGSYIVLDKEKKTIYGEAYQIFPDRIDKICEYGDKKELDL